MSDAQKMRAADYALRFIRSGQVVGLGTGTTAAFAIEGIARLVGEGLQITGVPTSIKAERLARKLGIPIVELNEVERVDLTIDGADQVDPELNMIKGGGGALTREKLVAIASEQRVILVDQSKLVARLGRSLCVPVEVLPFGWRLTARFLAGLGCIPRLREDGGSPFETDNRNYILDCDFGDIADASYLEKQIKQVPGVVESGLFIGLADVLIIGFDDSVEVRRRPSN
jgi:ribose 5-phosphate isomerase A